MPRAKKSMNAQPILKLDTDLAGALAVSETTELDLAFDKCIEQARDQIRAIDEKADFAIQVVTQSIRTQAAVAKGKVLLTLRERFDQVPALEGKWKQFLDSIEVGSSTACNWMNAAKAVDENQLNYGEDFLMNFSPMTLSKIQTLPSVLKEAVLDDAAESGQVPGQVEMTKLSAKPTTRLAKAMEQLEENALRQERIKNEGEKREGEKGEADKYEAKLLETIEQLKSQIAEDKIKQEVEAKEKERVEAELELLKYDDEAAREQRIKRVTNTLIVSIPAVLSDLQKYIAEKEYYSSKATKSLDDSLETLVNYLKPLYA